jgi:hypothetical protein
MGKLMQDLNAQLKTEHRQDAERCIVIYEHLRDTNDGRVWSSQWSTLVSTYFEGAYSNSKCIFKPTGLGILLLQSIESKAVDEIDQTHNKIREILRKYNNPEWGDCIIDEICSVFEYPTTIDIESKLE